MATRGSFPLAFLTCLTIAAVGRVPAQEPKAQSRRKADSNSALFESNRAVLVVTGMRVDESPENYVKDLSVAEGATVTVATIGGETQQKQTAAFTRVARSSVRPETYFTADFDVDLEAKYTITMTFRDGTILRVDDYTLPKSWKTHFYFHSTTGTKSPASVLRFVEDPRTQLRCCVYAVYPRDAYQRLGGRQLE